MELWWTPGTIDQSNRLNDRRDINHPDQTPFPPVIGKFAKVNRVTNVSKNQINIRDELLNLTIHSFSCDLTQKTVDNIRKRNKILGRSWVFGKQSDGLHKRARDVFNREFEGRAEEGHAIAFQFGGDAKRSNMQLELYAVNHGIKYWLEMLIRALVKEGYLVSYMDGVLPKAQIPSEWLQEGQTADVTITIDGKEQVLADAGFMIILATNQKSGKHICLNLWWPSFNVPEPIFVSYFSKSVDYWFALVRDFIIDPDTLAGLIGLRFLTTEIKANIEEMNAWKGCQRIDIEKETGDPKRKLKCAATLKEDEEDEDGDSEDDEDDKCEALENLEYEDDDGGDVEEISEAQGKKIGFWVLLFGTSGCLNQTPQVLHFSTSRGASGCLFRGPRLSTHNRTPFGTFEHQVLI
jgi:hypothetical protein